MPGKKYHPAFDYNSRFNVFKENEKQCLIPKHLSSNVCNFKLLDKKIVKVSERFMLLSWEKKNLRTVLNM